MNKFIFQIATTGRRLSFLVSCLFLALTGDAQVLVKQDARLMGSMFDFSVVADDSIQANEYIQLAINEVERIENLISEWRPHSQIAEVNRMAGIQPVKVAPEVFELTRRAIRFSEITNGAFDISIAAIDRVWRFDDSMDRLPEDSIIKSSIRNVGYQHIVLDSIHHTIFLKHKGMKIGFGATGKGYAADRGRQVLMNEGAGAGIVNASGDMSTWGKPLDANYWKIGITNPFQTDEALHVMNLRWASVTTSGDYRKFFEWEGKRYAHIINPKTGYPSTGITSVTVIGESAEIANGISTSIMVLGIQSAKELLKQFPTYGAFIISDKGKIKKINWNRAASLLRK